MCDANYFENIYMKFINHNAFVSIELRVFLLTLFWCGGGRTTFKICYSVLK